MFFFIQDAISLFMAIFFYYYLLFSCLYFILYLFTAYDVFIAYFTLHWTIVKMSKGLVMLLDDMRNVHSSTISHFCRLMIRLL